VGVSFPKGGRSFHQKTRVLQKHMSKGMALVQKRHFASLGKVETAILGGAKPVRAA